MTVTKTPPAAANPDGAAATADNAGSARRVWRGSRGTLVFVAALMVLVGVGVPAAAVISLTLRATTFGDRQVPVLAIIGGLAVLVLFFGWRLGLHPRLVQTDDQIEIINPFHRHRFDLADVTVIEPGADGLLVGTPAEEVEAWCVQKPTRAFRSGRRTRADLICDELRSRWVRYHLPDLDPGSSVRLRLAHRGEDGLLTELERSASLARLGHVFPPDEHAYPTDEVRRRWREVLNDRSRLTLVAEVGGRPAGYACYGEQTVHHLGVAAEFQRHGLGGILMDAAEDELFGDLSATEIGLWVLEANEVARGFYAGRGWTASGEIRTAEFPPYPPEVRMVRRNPHIARRGR